MEPLIKVIDTTNLTVEEYRTALYGQIDARTGQLIGLGFTYDSKTFSMSENAQNNLLGTFSAKDVLTYPFPWNTKDDSETYQIADIAEMETFFMTALAFKKAHQDSGTALKTIVRDTATAGELDLLKDNR